MPAHRKFMTPAIWGFYIVIGLEFLFMISPFALYFYSSYAGVLNFFHHWPATAWLTGFFLPHVSMTTSPILDSLKPLGFLLAALGLLVFGLGAVQVYGAKLFLGRQVSGGLYRISRHPQYFALTLLGFGVLLIWPRYLVLLSFVTMLFLYLLLARWEEQQCLERYGDSYREYMGEVGFIGPAWLTSWIPPAPAWTRRPTSLAVTYGLLLAVSVTGADVLRNYSLSQVSSFYTGNVAILSPAILGEDELRRVYQLAVGDQGVQGRLEEEGVERNGGWLIYVVPASWYLPDLPLESWEEIPPEHRSGHTAPVDFERGMYKVLFTKPRTHRPESRGREIVTTAYGREPWLRVRVNLDQGLVTAVESPPTNVVWGDIPTPLY